MVTTNFAKNRNSLHYDVNPKIVFFGKSPAALLRFGHFINVLFSFMAVRLFQKLRFKDFIKHTQHYIIHIKQGKYSNYI